MPRTTLPRRPRRTPVRFCACECGALAMPGNRFLRGHNGRGHGQPRRSRLRTVREVDHGYRTPCLIPASRSVTNVYLAVIDSSGRRLMRHRVVWEQQRGAIPPGMTIDHLCKQPWCLNVEHMEVVTPAENALRGDGPLARNARKTRCPRGHPLSGENLYVWVTPQGRRLRSCRQCRTADTRAYRARKRGRG